MRIGIVTGEYPPLEGGVGDFTQQLSRAIHARDHEIHILTTADKEPRQEHNNGFIVYRQVQDWGWGIHTRLSHWINEIKPDVVNIQYQAAAYQMQGGITLYPRWQRKHIQCPIVVTYHDLLPPYLFPKAGPLRQWTVHQLAQYSEGIIVTNGGDYRQITAALKNKAPEIRMIPIGSNIQPNPPANYNRKTWRTQQNFTDNDILVGFFGFLNRSKGVETLLNAIAQLAQEDYPVHLLFIGGRTGSSDVTNQRYADEIDALIKSLGIEQRVHRTGFTSPSEVSAALLATDICALPYCHGANLRHGTLHAALAHGNAIITTKPEIETPQLRDADNVILIPAEDSAALSSAIRTLWEHPLQRKELGKAAAELAKEFSWQRIAAHSIEFFRSLSKTPPNNSVR